ncbi:MAG: hypothetical protein ACYCW6_23565 [Candidatus Xenobia bacterium]
MTTASGDMTTFSEGALEALQSPAPLESAAPLVEGLGGAEALEGAGAALLLL